MSLCTCINKFKLKGAYPLDTVAVLPHLDRPLTHSVSAMVNKGYTARSTSGAPTKSQADVIVPAAAID